VASRRLTRQPRPARAPCPAALQPRDRRRLRRLLLIPERDPKGDDQAGEDDPLLPQLHQRRVSLAVHEWPIPVNHRLEILAAVSNTYRLPQQALLVLL
jgi:hypothetical protein